MGAIRADKVVVGDMIPGHLGPREVGAIREHGLFVTLFDLYGKVIVGLPSHHLVNVIRDNDEEDKQIISIIWDPGAA